MIAYYPHKSLWVMQKDGWMEGSETRSKEARWAVYITNTKGQFLKRNFLEFPINWLYFMNQCDESASVLSTQQFRHDVCPSFSTMLALWYDTLISLAYPPPTHTHTYTHTRFPPCHVSQYVWEQSSNHVERWRWRLHIDPWLISHVFDTVTTEWQYC